MANGLGRHDELVSNPGAIFPPRRRDAPSVDQWFEATRRAAFALPP